MMLLQRLKMQRRLLPQTASQAAAKATRAHDDALKSLSSVEASIEVALEEQLAAKDAAAEALLAARKLAAAEAEAAVAKAAADFAEKQAAEARAVAEQEAVRAKNAAHLAGEYQSPIKWNGLYRWVVDSEKRTVSDHENSKYTVPYTLTGQLLAFTVPEGSKRTRSDRGQHGEFERKVQR